MNKSKKRYEKKLTYKDFFDDSLNISPFMANALFVSWGLLVLFMLCMAVSMPIRLICFIVTHW